MLQLLNTASDLFIFLRNLSENKVICVIMTFDMILM